MLNNLFKVKYVYLIIFASLAAWAFFAYFTLNQLIKNQEIYAKLINVSGKQRMLSQKIPFLAHKIIAFDTISVNAQIESLIKEMKQNHNFLLENIPSEKIRKLYYEQPINLNQQLEDFYVIAKEFCSIKDDESKLHLEEQGVSLLPKLNDIVTAYEEENNTITNKLQQQEFFILIGTLFTLFLEAIFIVFPAIKNAQEKEDELIALNEKLEERINNKISALREQDELLAQQSRMAAMGEMLENIAHQWRQPLSLISTTASSMQIKNEFTNLTKENLDHSMNNIINYTNFLSTTIEDFREFFKENKQKQTFKLKEIYNKSMKLVWASFTHSDITIKTDIQDLEYHGFQNELIQVFINILNNANDALKTSKNLQKRLLFIDMYKTNDAIIIQFKDNAQGIEPEVQQHIFDAYFTTKGEKKGTGIGLYMCSKIIQEHFKGELKHENVSFEDEGKLERGSCFTIILPLNQTV